ncbi:MAG: iron ABC transporter permease [Candidatus Omnitrophica bacterium]|nr:iron ABC transporter permease [Candidatus Omnitrophota bacterium]
MKIKIFILVSILFFAVLLSLRLGEVDISLKDVFKILSGEPALELKSSVILDIRLPRILAALLIGAGLAVSGAVFQAVLRNPLAEPYTLGVSGGACLGVALAHLAAGYSFSLLFPAAGLVGAVFAVFVVYFLSVRRNFSTISLILSGIVMNFLFSSLVLVFFAFLKPSRVQSMMLWMMGDLSSVNMAFTKVAGVIILPAIAAVLILSKRLDILSLGDEKAHSLGLDVQKNKKYFYFLGSLITANCIVLGGVIGFVGLLMPHLMRRIFGTLNTMVLLTSAISGAVFLLLSDTFARTIISPLELPVGVVTGLIGGIFFLSLIFLGRDFRIG